MAGLLNPVTSLSSGRSRVSRAHQTFQGANLQLVVGSSPAGPTKVPNNLKSSRVAAAQSPDTNALYSRIGAQWIIPPALRA